MISTWANNNTLREGIFQRRGATAYSHKGCVIGIKEPRGHKDIYWCEPTNSTYKGMDCWTNEVNEAKVFSSPKEAFIEIADNLDVMSESFNGDRDFYQYIYVRAL